MSESDDLKMWADVWLTFDQKWSNAQLRGFIVNKPLEYQNEFKRRYFCMRDNRANGYKGEIKT